MRRFALLAAVLAVVAAPSRAEALGALVARPPATSFGTSGEVAVAVTPGNVTTWVRMRFVGAADSVAWLVPVPPDAAVDLASPMWLDALEDATAPRILTPDATPAGATCAPMAAITSKGDASAPPTVAAMAIADDPAALALILATWGFSPGALAEPAAAAVAEGQRLLVLRLDLSQGTTPTLRIHAPGSSTPMLLAHTPLSEPYTVWMLTDGRASLAGTTELAVPPASLTWVSASATNYEPTRTALLADSARSVLEATGPAAAKTISVLAGSGAVPGLVEAYAARVAPTTPEAIDAVRATLDALPTLPPACSLGTLVKGPPCAAKPTALDSGPLAGATDLRFAFAGTTAARWLTRIVTVTPPGASCHAIGCTTHTAPAVSPLVHAGSWGALCTAPPTPPPPGAVVPTPPPTTDPPSDPTEDGQGTVPPGDTPPPGAVAVDVASDMACACSGNGEEHQGSGCSGDSSGGSESSSGCSSSSGGSSESSSGCSSGSGESSGCSSGSSSSSSCGVARRPGRPAWRVSWLMFVLAAIALPLRRMTRRPRAR